MTRDDFYQDAVRIFGEDVYHRSDFAEIPDDALQFFQPSTWFEEGSAAVQAKAPNGSCTLTLFVEPEESVKRNGLPHYSAVLADSIGEPLLYGEANSFREIENSLICSAKVIRTMDGFPDESAIRNLLSCGLRSLTAESSTINTDILFDESIREPLRHAVEGTLLMGGQEKEDKYSIHAVIQKDDDTFTSAQFHLDGAGRAYDWQETPQEDLDSAILPLIRKGCALFQKDSDAIEHLGRHAWHPMKPAIPHLQDVIRQAPDFCRMADLCGYNSTKDEWENQMTEAALMNYIQSHPDASKEGKVALEEFRKRIGKSHAVSRSACAGR